MCLVRRSPTTQRELTHLSVDSGCRGRSPPGASPRGASPWGLPPLTPLSTDTSLDSAPARHVTSLRAALLVALTALLAIAAAVALAPTALSHVLDLSRAARSGASGDRGGDANHAVIAAGCSNIDVVDDFDLDR